MTLDAYLKQHRITHRDFEEMIGCEQPTVSRFVAGRIPSPELMRLISEKTRGEVTPNDFFGIEAARPKRATRKLSEQRKAA